MEFRSGDDVIHPGYGLGNVVRLEEKQLAGTELCWYYVLAIGTATVWVPMRSDGSTTLRAVTSKHELNQYRTLLKSRPTILERDHKQWRLDMNARLNQGSFRTLCEVVRDLTALGWYRPIGEVDARLLNKVRDNLCREWAAAAGLSINEATDEVDALLLAGRETYRA